MKRSKKKKHKGGKKKIKVQKVVSEEMCVVKSMSVVNINSRKIDSRKIDSRKVENKFSNKHIGKQNLNEEDVEEAYATEIIANLWLGNKHSAYNIPFFSERNIRRVVNVSSKIPNYFESRSYWVRYFTIPCQNKKKNREKFRKLLSESFNFINESLKYKDQAVLVHCEDGRNLSAIVVAYYIMNKFNELPKDVVEYIQKRRKTSFQKKTALLKCLLSPNSKAQNLSIQNRT